MENDETPGKVWDAREIFVTVLNRLNFNYADIYFVCVYFAIHCQLRLGGGGSRFLVFNAINIVNNLDIIEWN